MRLHRISQRNSWVYLLPQIRRQDLCCQERVLSRERVSRKRSKWEESRAKYYLLKARVTQLRKMFLWCLHRFERRLMMMIKILLIKLLLNFVGPQGRVPHQSGTATLSWKSCCWTTVNLRTMKKRWRAQIPTNG